MATLEEIGSALKKADAAGDIESARKLAQAYQQMQAAPVSEPASVAPQRKTPQRWIDVAGEAVANLPSSAAKLAEGVYETARHPIEATQNILDIGSAAVKQVMPESVNRAVETVSKYVPGSRATAENRPEQEAKLQQMKDFYKGRYGSMEGFKRAVSEDPLGVASDVSAVTGAGGALMAGKLPRMAQAATAVSEAVNPVSAALRAGKATKNFIGNRAADLVGMTTGAGGEAFRQAFKAGQEGGPKAAVLTEQMRTDQSMMQPVKDMENALKAYRKNASDTYAQKMSVLEQDQTPLDLDAVENAVNDALSFKHYKGFDTDKELKPTRDKIIQAINDFKQQQIPTGLQRLQGQPVNVNLNTIGGFNALKQRIDTLADWDNPRSPETMIVSKVTNAIKDEVSKQNPAYRDVLQEYAQAAEEAKNIEKEFSLSKKASEDTKLRKIQGITRNNAYASYGGRLKKLETLEPYGAENVAPAVYGQALRSPTPRGLANVSGYGGVAAGIYAHNPLAIPFAAASSPRLMGEAAYLTGKGAAVGGDIAGKVQQAADALNIDPRVLANYLYQAQQPKGD